MSDRAEEVLRMEHITKQFGSVYANRNVSFDVLSGEVHTLLGENGAGKSTLMNVLFGLYQPTGGEIYIRGAKGPDRITGAGGQTWNRHGPSAFYAGGGYDYL